VGGHPAVYERGHAVNERTRLPRPRAGHDEQGGIAVTGGVGLGRIERRSLGGRGRRDDPSGRQWGVDAGEIVGHPRRYAEDGPRRQRR
jgi:hypothetical protein